MLKVHYRKITLELKYKQTKLNEFNSKKKLMQSQLDQLNKLHNKFKELQKQINSCINQSIKLINDKLEQAQTNFDKILEPNFDVFDEKDLIYLSNHQNKELNFTLELNEEKEAEFIDQVEQQVQKLQFEINLKEISKLLGMLQPANLNKKEENKSVEIEGERENEVEEEEEEFHKTVKMENFNEFNFRFCLVQQDHSNKLLKLQELFRTQIRKIFSSNLFKYSIINKFILNLITDQVFQRIHSYFIDYKLQNTIINIIQSLRQFRKPEYSDNYQFNYYNGTSFFSVE